MKFVFSLRPWTPADAESLARHADNMHVARYLTDRFPYPYGIEDARAFIRITLEDNVNYTRAIDVNGQAVGCIGITFQSDILHKNAELGYWLSEDYWGRGITTQAVKAITETTFEHYDINRLFARVFGINKASARVLEKVGYRLESHIPEIIYKNGRYYDELIYGFRRSMLTEEKSTR